MIVSLYHHCTCVTMNPTCRDSFRFHEIHDETDTPARPPSVTTDIHKHCGGGMEPWMKEVVDFVNYRPEVLDPWCPGVTVDRIRNKCKREDLPKEEPQWLKEFNKRKWVLPKKKVGNGEKACERFEGLHCSKETKEEFSWVHRLLTEGEEAVVPEHDVSTLMHAHWKLISRNPSSETLRPSVDENCSSRSFKKIPPRERRIKDISHHIEWGKDFHDAMENCLEDFDPSDFPTPKRPRWLESMQPTKKADEKIVETAASRASLQLKPMDGFLGLHLNGDHIEWPRALIPLNPPEWELKSQLDRIACRIDGLSAPMETHKTGVENTDSIPSVCCPSGKDAKMKADQRESIVSDMDALATCQTLVKSDSAWGEELAGLDLSRTKRNDGMGKGKGLVMSDVEVLDVGQEGEGEGKDLFVVDVGALAVCQTQGNVAESKVEDSVGFDLSAVCLTQDNGGEGKGKDLFVSDMGGGAICPTQDTAVESRGNDWLSSILPSVLETRDNEKDGKGKDLFLGISDGCQTTDDGVQGKNKEPVFALPAECQTGDGGKGKDKDPHMCTGPVAVLPTGCHTKDDSMVDGSAKDSIVPVKPACETQAIVVECGASDSKMGVRPTVCQSQGNGGEGTHIEESSMSGPGASAACHTQGSAEKGETSAVSRTGVSDGKTPHTANHDSNTPTDPRPIPLPRGNSSDKVSKTAPAPKRLLGKKSPSVYNLMKGTPSGEFLSNLDIYVKVKPLPVNSFRKKVKMMTLKQEERWVTGILLGILDEVKECRKDRGDWEGGEDPFSKVEAWLTGILATNPLNHRYLPHFESSITPEDVETLKGIFDGNLETYLPCMAKLEREQKAFWAVEKACLYPRALKAKESYKEVGLHQLEVIISLKRGRVRQYPKIYNRIDTMNLFEATREELLYSDSNTPEFSHVEDMTEVNPLLAGFGRSRRGMYCHFLKQWNPKRALAEEENFVPLSKDPTAKKFADEIGADLVITSEALRAFASMSMDPKCGEGFEIPFSSCPAFTSGKLGKRVIIDSPLLGRKLGLRERDCMKFEAFCQDEFCKDPVDRAKGVLTSYHYSHWTLDEHIVLVRRIDRVRAEKNQSRSQSVWVKPEYLEGLEEIFTRQELLSWWMDNYLREPSSPMLLQRIDVFGNHIGHVSTFRSGALLVGCARRQGTRIKPRQTFSLLQKTIARFSREDPGSFLLTHCPGQVHSTLYFAVDSDSTSQHSHPPLPIDPAESTYTGWFDLHKAHENSGEFDESKEWFLPPNVTNYFVDMPGTFPRDLAPGRHERGQMAL